MPKLSDFGAVIFDMDGLVLDTESTYRRAWQNAVGTMGYVFSDEFCESLSGLSAENGHAKIVTTFGANFNTVEFDALSGNYWHNWVNTHGIAVKTGFEPLLDKIKAHNIPYCLATNSSAKNARECLGYAGLSETFAVVLSRDDVEYGKPAPDIFLKAAERLQVDITNCLVLEDSYSGVKAAARAGAYVIGVPSVWPIDNQMRPYCHKIAANLAELLESFSA